MIQAVQDWIAEFDGSKIYLNSSEYVEMETSDRVLKGFPNQLSDLVKLSRALSVAHELLSSGGNLGDDGEFGEALLRNTVIGTGHKPIPVEEYLQAQNQLEPSRRSYRTSARGLRELFRLMSCFDKVGDTYQLSPLGTELARNTFDPLNTVEVARWSVVVSSITVGPEERGFSHPYQVLIRLIGECPGITRAMCALALEANDDSDIELERIKDLANIGNEEEVWRQIGGDPDRMANWNNAKKVFPSFAEQLGAVVKVENCFTLSVDAEQNIGNAAAVQGDRVVHPEELEAGIRTNHRDVDPTTIAIAGQYDRDRNSAIHIPSQESIAATNALRAERLTRHNRIVRMAAEVLSSHGAQLSEDPFDCLARGPEGDLVVEVKTLSGSQDDERARMRDALCQLLYYQKFALPEGCENPTLLGLFERKPSDGHIEWLEDFGILVAWIKDGGFDSAHADSCPMLKILTDFGD